jgi:hypothetical protein
MWLSGGAVEPRKPYPPEGRMRRAAGVRSTIHPWTFRRAIILPQGNEPGSKTGYQPL